MEADAVPNDSVAVGHEEAVLEVEIVRDVILVVEEEIGLPDPFAQQIQHGAKTCAPKLVPEKTVSNWIVVSGVLRVLPKPASGDVTLIRLAAFGFVSPSGKSA